MIKLTSSHYPQAYELYYQHKAFFPIIAGVLLCEQDGVVYTDNLAVPSQFYVEHTFGFAQIFGLPVFPFEADLRDYLFYRRDFLSSKVRLYTPNHPSFLESPEWERLCSKRQRFTLSPFGDMRVEKLGGLHFPQTVEIEDVDSSNVELIQKHFGVVSRFWRTAGDFISKGKPVVAFFKGIPAAICYAAAVADDQAEIDVFTVPDYRCLGLGRLVVQLFLKQCQSTGMIPVWDCFINNVGSMALCQSTGFVPAGAPYPFFTIAK
ncbi:MAG: GNAT family N-acetyltransferase [Elusimicrobia bacterium]|nr:GNAT family N-acetyltransferase [Elusimicrobiota bacterium]